MNVVPYGRTSTDPELDWPSFGQLARQLAGVSDEQLVECREEKRRLGGRLGTIFRQRGLLTQAQVRDILRQQARFVARAVESAPAAVSFPYPAFLSVVLPAFNEQDNIQDTLEAACAILPEFVQRFELVIVDDGSIDETAALVRECAEQDPRVRLVRHEQNRGYGAAVSTGLRAAHGEFLIFMDSDGQFSLLDLPKMLAPLGQFDLVFGYRSCRADSFRRLLMAWGWNRLVSLVLGVQVRDLDCAFKLFPRRVIERLQLTATSPALNAEILLQCVRGGLTLTEVPVNHFPRYHGVAAGCGWRMIVRAFRDLARLWKCRWAPTVSLKAEAGQCVAGQSLDDSLVTIK